MKTLFLLLSIVGSFAQSVIDPYRFATNGGGGGGYTLPTNGLVLKLTADTFSGMANNTTITNWPDSGPFGNNATLGGAGPIYKTTDMNGHPSVAFAGTTRYDTPAIDLSGTRQITVLAVAKGSTATSVILEATDNWFLNTGGFILAVDSGPVVTWAHNLTGGKSSVSNATSPSSGGVIIATSDGTLTSHEAAFTFNGTAAANWTTDGNSSGNFISTAFHIGYRTGPTLTFTGSLSELFVWNRLLSGTELSDLQTYYRGKYGY